MQNEYGYLIHSQGVWKKHKYVRKYVNTHGKTVYVYGDANAHKDIRNKSLDVRAYNNLKDFTTPVYSRRENLEMLSNDTRKERALARLDAEEYYDKHAHDASVDYDKTLRENSIKKYAKKKVSDIKETYKSIEQKIKEGFAVKETSTIKDISTGKERTTNLSLDTATKKKKISLGIH